MVDDAVVDVVVRSLEADRAVPGSVSVRRSRQVGPHAVLAVELVARDSGGARRGFAGAVLRDGLWRPSGGWSSAVGGPHAGNDVWRAWGGWSNTDRTVYGGWVADGPAARLRVTDPAGRVEEDELRDGIAILVWAGDLDPAARAELLDEHGAVLHSGLTPRTPQPRPA